MFEQVLFHAADLDNTEHTIVLSDASSVVELNYLDVDSVSCIPLLTFVLLTHLKLDNIPDPNG